MRNYGQGHPCCCPTTDERCSWKRYYCYLSQHLNGNISNMRAFLISFYIFHYFHRINYAISLSPGCLSWKDEFRRLYFLTPWDGNMNDDASPKGQRPPPWIDNCIKDGCESNQYSPETIKTAHYGKVSCNTYIFPDFFEK